MARDAKPNRDKDAKGFTAAEKVAMRERARELKAQEKANRTRADGERDLLSKVQEMAEPDRSIARRIHELVTAAAPELMPRTWYGMPAYARDGKVLCFFQAAGKFDTRYATFGFNDSAGLDDGNMWPVAFAVTRLTKADEARIVALLKRAVA